MHLLYGFDPLIGQDALKHQMKNYQTRCRDCCKSQMENWVLDSSYLSYLIQDNIK